MESASYGLLTIIGSKACKMGVVFMWNYRTDTLEIMQVFMSKFMQIVLSESDL